MTPADLTAKAQRAAEWLPTAFEKLDAGLYADTWTVFQLEDEAKDLWGYLHCDLSDRMMIAFCEDRGWQDDHIGDANKMVEADGVEWRTRTVDSSIIQVGKDPIEVCVHNASYMETTWGWSIARYDQVKARGQAPTREEARRRAAEAARGMNNENV